MKRILWLLAASILVSTLILPAQAGSWQRVGQPKAWAGTIAGVGLSGMIYTVEASGTLYVTNPATGAWKQLGKPDFASTRFMMAAAGGLFTIEKDGSMYAVDPADGSWRRVGQPKAWAGTIAGVGLNGMIYTVEASGALYVTNPATGSWKQLGKPDFAATRFMMAAAGGLFTIEKDGSLYAVDPADGTWQRLGKQGAWAGTIAACGSDRSLLTVESSGALYGTNPGNGVWQQLGKPDFAATVFMIPCAGNLYTIERDGSLYQVKY